jgi:hypothetical protein
MLAMSKSSSVPAEPTGLDDLYKRTCRNNIVALHRHNNQAQSNQNGASKNVRNQQRQPEKKSHGDDIEWADAALANDVDSNFTRDSFDMEKFKEEMKKREGGSSSSLAPVEPPAQFDFEQFKREMRLKDQKSSNSMDSFDTGASVMGSSAGIDSLILDESSELVDEHQVSTRSRFGGRFFSLDNDEDEGKDIV